MQRSPASVPFRDAVKVWIRVALQSFGGPAGQIGVMHRILVEEKKWVSELRGNRTVQSALSAITAAVAGVILSIWFALHVLFRSVAEVETGWIRLFVPEWSTLSLLSLLIAVGALVAMLRFHVGMGKTLLASAAVGLLWRLLIGT